MRWALHRELRVFILVPVLINLCLFAVITTALFSQFDSLIQWLHGYIPDWLAFIYWLILALIVCLFLLVYGYSFSLLTNIIAAPFYGFLASRVSRLAGYGEGSQESFAQMIPRTLARELGKLWYFLSRGLLILLLSFALSFFPPINLLVPIIGLIWGAWCMSVQYTDYAADNNCCGFKELRYRLRKNKNTSYGLGGLIMAGTMLPLANIFVLPIAVIAGTLYWEKELNHSSFPTR